MGDFLYKNWLLRNFWVYIGTFWNQDSTPNVRLPTDMDSKYLHSFLFIPCIKKTVTKCSFLWWLLNKCLCNGIHTHWIPSGAHLCEHMAGGWGQASVQSADMLWHTFTAVRPDWDCSSLVFWLQVSQGFNKPGLSPHSKNNRSDLARDSSSPRPTGACVLPQPPAEGERSLRSLWTLPARLQTVSVQLLRRCSSVGHPIQSEGKKWITF